MKAPKTKKDLAIALLLVGWLLGFIALVFGVSAWWLLSAPFYAMVAVAITHVMTGGSLSDHGPHKGTEVKTCLLTVGDKKKPCTLIICKDYLAVETAPVDLIYAKGEWEAAGSPGFLLKYRDVLRQVAKVPLADITGLLFQQMTILTGFGIDYTDADGKARLMFINDGEFQANRTRKILKAIQDAYVALSGELKVAPPAINDISRRIKKAQDSAVHRVE